MNENKFAENLARLKTNSFINYIGQLRLYSLLDLIIFCFALLASAQDFVGIILLHIAFLAYLETRHSHSYRKPVPKYFWLVLTLVGILFYRHWEVIGFLLSSYIYTKKTNGYFGALSPIMRGLQYLFLAAGVIGYNHPLTWIAFIVIFIRSFAGDLRDTGKDKAENLKTLPVIIGLDRNVPVIYFITLLATSYIWWSFTTLPIYMLLGVFIIQITTYNITAR